MSANSDWQKTLSTIGDTTSTPIPVLLATGTPVSTISETDQKLTATEILGRKLLVAYTQLQQQSNLSAADQQKILSKIVDDTIASTTPAIAPYTISDITFRPGEGTEVMTAYHNDLTAAITKYSYSDLGTELDTLNAAISNQDEAVLAKIKKAHDAYTTLAKAMLKISAPASVAQVHLNIVNGFSIMAESTGVMSQAIADPVTSVAALQHYVTGAEMTKVALKSQLTP